MKLHNHKEVFKEIVIATAQNTKGLQTYQVEKDYFVSLFLKELSKIDSELEIVFKGGTSLSKCYGVIERFSEDIDLTINFKNEKAGKGIKKRLKDKIVSAIDNLKMKFLNSGSVQSDRDFNNYEVEFEKNFDATPEMIPFIKIETISVYKPYPTEKRLVGNYITKYLQTLEEGNDLIKKYELEDFEMNVQTIERTFIDKLFAICDYHLAKTYNRYSRHIYDIHMILNSNLLKVDIIYKIVDDVIKDRQRFYDRNLSSKPGTNIKKILNEIISKEVFKDDYTNVSSSFIYNYITYEESINSLKKISESDILPEIIKSY